MAVEGKDFQFAAFGKLAGPRQDLSTSAGTKVFWFFSSEKNAFSVASTIVRGKHSAASERRNDNEWLTPFCDGDRPFKERFEGKFQPIGLQLSQRSRTLHRHQATFGRPPSSFWPCSQFNPKAICPQPMVDQEARHLFTRVHGKIAAMAAIVGRSGAKRVSSLAPGGLPPFSSEKKDLHF